MALKILAVAAEAFPLAKTGGLADAVSGLCRSVQQAGAEVTLLLPAYRGAARHVDNLHEVARLENLPGGAAVLLAGDSPELGTSVLLIQNDDLYDRDDLYVDGNGMEYVDNAVRFAMLGQVGARIAQGIAQVPRPDIVHVHDWHAALVPLYMRQWGVNSVKVMLTLHNVAFQGIFPLDVANSLGIESRFCTESGAEFWSQLSFLKAGIQYADLISVVSRNYAREILSPQFGCGLEQVLAARSDRLVAIPNGIDAELWNPRDDIYLAGRAFDIDRMGDKEACKRELQRNFQLVPDCNATIVAVGSRMTTQKMADVAAQALPAALDAHPDLQVCILGHGDKAIEADLRELGRRYPGRCGVKIGFDEQQAHMLHAGADILLHGSRFEPFGLTPLYAMRYGTIPIGSKVGGMVDTIVDPGRESGITAMRLATGILFEGEAPADMEMAIARAMALRRHPQVWRAMQHNAMAANFSWSRSTPLYARAYQSLRPDIPMETRVEHVDAGSAPGARKEATVTSFALAAARSETVDARRAANRRIRSRGRAARVGSLREVPAS